MKKALVTGANGFIGSALTRELIKNGVEVIAACRKGHSENIPAGARILEFDMANFAELKSQIPDRDIDVIFHVAWAGSSGAQRADYALQLHNAKCTCDAVKIASEMEIKRFVGIGTIAQFDCMIDINNDDVVLNPISCYAMSKNAAQLMSKTVANSSGVEYVWCILSNTYGIGDPTSNFVNYAAMKMLNGERASFTLGEQNYDFCYITDIAHGIYLCGKSGKTGKSYYIGSGKPRKLKEYIELIRKTIDPKISVYLGEIPFNGKSLSLETYSCEKIHTDTGYSARATAFTFCMKKGSREELRD